MRSISQRHSFSVNRDIPQIGTFYNFSRFVCEDEQIFCRPSLLDSHPENRTAQPVLSCGLGDRQTLAINFDISRASSIGRLSPNVSPVTVPRSVWAVVVFALDLGAVRTRTHVSNKRFETVDPSLVNSDSSSSVVFPSWRFRIQASLLQSGPHVVFATAFPRGGPLAVSMSALIHSSSVLSVQAPTTARLSAVKFSGVDNLLVSANAPTFPSKRSEIVQTVDSQPTKG